MLFNLLPEYTATDYLMLTSITTKLQRTGFIIAFIMPIR